MASIRGILNIQSLNELTSEKSEIWIVSYRCHTKVKARTLSECKLKNSKWKVTYHHHSHSLSPSPYPLSGGTAT